MQNRTDMQFADFISTILNFGNAKGDRTGTGTVSKFALLGRYNNDHGRVLPVVSGKKTNIESIIHENMWFISSITNIKYLTDNGVKIWNQWADENGDLGPVYGHQWRKREDIKIVGIDEVAKHKVMVERGYTKMGNLLPTEPDRSAPTVFPTVWRREIDQLANAIERLKTNPECRRIIVDAWNPADLEDMKLPPCHMTFVFNTHELDLNSRVELYIEANLANAIGYINFGSSGDLTDKEVAQRAREVLLSEVFPNKSVGVRGANEFLTKENIPVYALDCAMVQRSTERLH